jgi:hypothetical protein
MQESSVNPFQAGSPGDPIRLTAPLGTESRWETWLRFAAVRDIRLRLASYGVKVPVEINQPGSRFLAVGTVLPILRDELNSLLESLGRPQMNRVTWSIGLSLQTLPDRPYVGVRIHQSNPNSTVAHVIHDQIFDSLQPHLVRGTGMDSWERRQKRDYWSIWTWLAEPGKPAASTDRLLELYVRSLAALEGVAWSRSSEPE